MKYQTQEFIYQLIYEKGYNKQMAIVFGKIIDGMIERSPHRVNHIYSAAKNCDILSKKLAPYLAGECSTNAVFNPTTFKFIGYNNRALFSTILFLMQQIFVI